MNKFTQETEVLDNTETPIKKTKQKKAKANGLVKEAVDALTARTENEFMPYFLLNPADKTNNVFAHLFIGQHCRNAYAGLFVKLDEEQGTTLNPKEKEWVGKFRHKGYACVVISSLNKFKRCIEDYKATAGRQGYNYFYSTYERAHN